MLSRRNFSLSRNVHQRADHLSSITGPGPKWGRQDAYLSNTYMIGAAFTDNCNRPHALLGVPNVENGEDGEQTM